MSARIRIGTQNWLYADWFGPFYPEGTSQPEALRFYPRAFDTVEVDATFYAVPPARTVRGWLERTPPDFVFALKLPREITHERRLVGTAALLSEFLDRARLLGDRLGPLLVQLGPDFTPASATALQQFLPLLPRDLRFAVEFRDPGWISRETHELLTMHGVAFALTDGPWISRRWLLELVDRPSGIDTFGYFSNFFEGHAPASARSLQSRLGIQTTDPGSLGEQISLF